jgi:methionyl-tRNA synthetase
MEITIDDFNKLDIRIGKILKAKKIEGSKKLLKLEVDLGEEKRVVVAGIAEDYEPEEIEGRQVPILVNLKPAKLMGIKSEGMILAADEEGKAILLHPEREVKLGSRVR